ncbi:MAG: N-acetylglucosamine-6-phosphate deacetylase [Planctomycetes bacterium]|nr:N-acetylglucosamine-6-phosphate deacetylase [Planctomycetota bacterium]
MAPLNLQMDMHIPGFVDLQVNGYRGTDFSGPDLAEESFARACRQLLGQGTAAFLPTLITSPVEVYRRNLALISGVMARPEFQGRLLGIHLEGPFISRRAGAAGAHNPAWVLEPDVRLLEEFQERAAGRVRLLTIAAELPGAVELARRAIGLGITVSLGHQMAGDDDLARLVRAGATALTHLGNGVPEVLPRHPNPVWSALACDDLRAMVIADGHHLPPSFLKVVLRAKGVGRVAVVSDQASVAGLPPGRYRALGADVVLEPSGRLHMPERGCLAGSSATILQCMNHLASLGLLRLEELQAVGFHNPLRIIGARPEEVRSPRQVAFDPAARRFDLVAQPGPPG